MSPMPDPLDNIMGMLKNKGTVDPNQAAARSAQIKGHRTTMGANPQATKKPPHQGVKKKAPPDAMPQTAGAPQGISEDFQDNPNMMSVVVDAMNEAIIGLKTEIHRAKDPEMRRNLEKQAQGVRQQIIDLGGEPIYADESIEEGLKKLRGHGAVGVNDTQWYNLFSPGANKSPQAAGTDHGVSGTDWATSLFGGGKTMTSVQQQPSAPATSTAAPASRDIQQQFGAQQMRINTPRVSAPQVPLPEIPGPMTADSGPDYFGQHVADPTKDGAVNELEELINRVTGREVTPMPEMVVDANYVNELISQYGLEPRSEEEIAETARVIVERQRLPMEQRVQREIDRFEQEHEHEFAKAQQQIDEAAKSASADRQEEMAARGMFYSSIMANSLEKIDKTALDLIGEIARDAANRVADLHADLQDIGQWAILEEEFVRREMEAQERQHRQMLMTMHLEVATWADQMAMDSWYKQNTLQLQSDQMALQGVQVKMMHAEQQGQNLAAAFMADHPLVQNTLVGMGISQEKFAAMSLEQQAGLVRTTIGFNEVEQQMRMNELQMRAIVAEIALKNAQLSLQAQIATGQFAMQGAGMAMELAMHRDRMGLAWAQHGLDEQSLAWQMRRGSGGSAVAGSSWSMDRNNLMSVVHAYGFDSVPFLQHELGLAREHGTAADVQYVNSLLTKARGMEPTDTTPPPSSSSSTIGQGSQTNFWDSLLRKDLQKPYPYDEWQWQGSFPFK